MNTRHQAIGIKQQIHLEWMQKATNLLLAGIDNKSIRSELHDYLGEKKRNDSESKGSEQTRTFVVNNLMNIWVTPAPELVPFRDASLALIQAYPSESLSVHWGMISASYPFWYNVARQTGRLLALQDQVTQAQIIKRLKEKYGDRQTISRYARYVIRSFVEWGILKDTGGRGHYEKLIPRSISDTRFAIILIESLLLASSEAKGPLNLMVNHPALFPFQLPAMTGDFIARNSERIEANRFGLDEVTLSHRLVGK